ncbi:hypothetical protein VPH35_082244 [Triticum aestivum]
MEEPPHPASPEFHRKLLSGSPDRSSTARPDPVGMLAYPVHDYTAQPASCDESMRSYNRNFNVIPSVTSPVQEECAKWHYRWNLYFEDGTFPPRRGPVHSRLTFGGEGGGQGGGGAADSAGGGAAGGNRGYRGREPDEGRDGGHVHGDRHGSPQGSRRRQLAAEAADGAPNGMMEGTEKM